MKNTNYTVVELKFKVPNEKFELFSEHLSEIKYLLNPRTKIHDEFIIGKITYKHSKDEFGLEVTHIGTKNKFRYNSTVVIKIEGKIPSNIMEKSVRCHIKYTDEFNRILCKNVEIEK